MYAASYRILTLTHTHIHGCGYFYLVSLSLNFINTPKNTSSKKKTRFFRYFERGQRIHTHTRTAYTQRTRNERAYRLHHLSIFTFCGFWFKRRASAEFVAEDETRFGHRLLYCCMNSALSHGNRHKLFHHHCTGHQLTAASL